MVPKPPRFTPSWHSASEPPLHRPADPVPAPAPAPAPAEELFDEELTSAAIEEVDEPDLVDQLTAVNRERIKSRQPFVNVLGKAPENLGELLEGVVRMYESGQLSDTLVLKALEQLLVFDNFGILATYKRDELEGLVRSIKRSPSVREQVESGIRSVAASEYVEGRIDGLFRRLFGRSLQALFVNLVEGTQPKRGLMGLLGGKEKIMREMPVRMDTETIEHIKTLMVEAIVLQFESGGESLKSTAAEIASLIPGARDPQIIQHLGLKHEGEAVTNPDQFAEILTDFRDYFVHELDTRVRAKLANGRGAALNQAVEYYLRSYTVSLFGGKLILELAVKGVDVGTLKKTIEKHLEEAGITDAELVDLYPGFNLSKANTNTRPGEALPE